MAKEITDDIMGLIPDIPEIQITPDSLALTIYENLKPKDQVFVENYCLVPNALRAYQLSHPESTEESARGNSSRYLKQPHIQAAIKELQKQTANKYDIPREYIMKRLLAIADNDKDNFLALKALDLMSKILGYNQPDVQVNTQPITFMIVEPKNNEFDDATDVNYEHNL